MAVDNLHIMKSMAGIGEYRRKTRNEKRRRLKLLSYNIQVGISTNRHFDYIAQSWKHFIPHTARHENLKSIARLIQGFDIVGLQELDIPHALRRGAPAGDTATRSPSFASPVAPGGIAISRLSCFLSTGSIRPPPFGSARNTPSTR